MANLAIFAGVRKDISQMSADEQETLTNLLLLMDKYDLYGKLAIPKKNDPLYEVPEIYRIAAGKKGAFVNATPGENFGLTVVESAACGLPVVASPTGGPKEIIENAQNGILVNVDNHAEISDALKKIIANPALWEEYSRNGILTASETYSWESHANTYIQLLDSLSAQKPQPKNSPGNALLKTPVFFISDLDGTLIDDENAQGLQELMDFLETNKEKIIFGISTGRNKALTREALQQHPLLSRADILICSVGTEIYYSTDFLEDKSWKEHINYQWKRQKLVEVLQDYPGLELQEPEAQTAHKLSYYINGTFSDEHLSNLYKKLEDNQLRAKIYVTDNKHLDLVPVRSGKGKAVHYLSYKWKKPIQNFLVSGNGGNDLGMLGGKTNGIVVSNHSPELIILKENPNVYFSKKPLAEGVLEGIQYYIKNKKNLRIIFEE